jgi:hypothetical protein
MGTTPKSQYTLKVPDADSERLQMALAGVRAECMAHGMKIGNFILDAIEAYLEAE